LEAAVRLAQWDTGTVSAITVVEREDTSPLEPPDKTSTNPLRRELDELLQTAANFARSRGVLLRPVLREGHPANTIIACAMEAEAGLVVLGVNRKAGPSDLGNTADQVARQCPCTVLIVR
jgi:nucleotide-binding universal stress UspA family protein